ncbi:hypothetical protein Fbal_3557 [Ferrimonas balearica DSM 9799]|uniref:DUF3718 domain-containing protein n=1 Tax=Ferrimonas balearica (strain DSM 9799 / CCM 4581 / KCTC 23876 / PAT) TaxID=550540 RepID=E1SNU7_FERBD|nr:DUF3718 domain-containing protein [Ferrimonas balearica]ADN77754.1 hypothetical protein Fbal_3557 [Ferrimonas balearica DSM 9799]MBY5981828.1 DUF3718 domain-containing protein [Ferrimonas balearica]
MKAVALTAMISLGFIATSQAASVEFVPQDRSTATKLCIAAATMKPMQLRQAIKHQGLTEQSAVRAIDCNDENIATFAARYNPDRRSVRRLGVYAPQGTVTIQEQAQTHSDTPVVIALTGRYR